MSDDRISRRAFVAAAAASATTLIGCADDDVPAAPSSSSRDVARDVPASSGSGAPSPPPSTGTPPAPNDGGDDDPTPECLETKSNIEGPFYTPNAPSKTVLADASTPGTKLTIKGRVRSAKSACGAIGGALLDVWQANAKGDYDNAGFTLRGKLTADAAGNFVIETIVPGRYLDGAEYRPMHIHVKVSAKGHRPLTTQLYFADDPYNAIDEYFLAPLAMKTKDEPDGRKSAKFDFVLRPI
jgi:protocatechuate 3,4-dioxygenase beta subunit